MTKSLRGPLPFHLTAPCDILRAGGDCAHWARREENSDDILACLANLSAEHGAADHAQFDCGSMIAENVGRAELDQIGVQTLFIQPQMPLALKSGQDVGTVAMSLSTERFGSILPTGEFLLTIEDGFASGPDQVFPRSNDLT